MAKDRSKTKRAVTFQVTVLYGPADDMGNDSMDAEALRFAMQTALVDLLKKRMPLGKGLRGSVVVRAHDIPTEARFSAEEYFEYEVGEEK